MGSFSQTLTNNADDLFVGSDGSFNTSINNYAGTNFANNYAVQLWTGVSIPQNATITAASISWNNAQVSGTPLIAWQAIKAVNPSQIASYADFSGRTKTTATATESGGGSTGDKTSSSLVSIIQELANQTGGTGANVITYLGPTGGGFSEFCRVRDVNLGTGPSISITWTDPVTAGGPILQGRVLSPGRIFGGSALIC